MVTAARAERLLDDQTGQLVTERNRGPAGLEHARLQAPLQAVQSMLRSLFEQPQLGLGRHRRHQVEQAAGLRIPRGGAGQDGIAQAGRDLAGGRSQHLGDEERVALSGREHRGAVPARPVRQRSTPSRDSGARCRRSTPGAVASRPSIARRGCAGSSSSSR